MQAIDENMNGLREIFETGIKVIDVLVPLVGGDKAGLFGGASVGGAVLIMRTFRSFSAGRSEFSPGADCAGEFRWLWPCLFRRCWRDPRL